MNCDNLNDTVSETNESEDREFENESSPKIRPRRVHRPPKWLKDCYTPLNNSLNLNKLDEFQDASMVVHKCENDEDYHDTINLKFIRSKENETDPMTKGMPGPRLSKLRELGLRAGSLKNDSMWS